MISQIKVVYLLKTDTMSKELFERLMSMPADDIITELKGLCNKKEILDENSDMPLSSHEAALHFQKNGTLSLEELNTLMNKKIEEMANNGNICDGSSNM